MLIFFAAALPVLAAGSVAPPNSVRLATPRVEYRTNEASASRSPWIDANGWQILRAPDGRYFYNVGSDAGAAALACAEAYAYGAKAMIYATGAAAQAFHRMVAFLGTLPDAPLTALKNIGVIDDGSPETGELMSALARRNLLYGVVNAPDPRLDLNVRIGSPEYPRAEAANPDFLAHKIRSQLGDDKRLVRLYGSEVVVARLTGDPDHERLELLNYAERPVESLRVRVRGAWAHQRVMAFDKPQLKLSDVSLSDGGTEFTVPEMSTYTAIDLSR